MVILSPVFIYDRNLDYVTVHGVNEYDAVVVSFAVSMVSAKMNLSGKDKGK